MADYELDIQVGHLLRRANQRHRSIFNAEMPVRIPPTQFAVLAQLRSEGELSQNLLGRKTAMDSATITGVIARLADKGWVSTAPSESDNRMVSVSLTDSGHELIESLVEPALRITELTLSRIAPEDRAAALRLLTLLASEGEE